eukprot:GFUD01100044.1.p1 GENE.GFUD01100044.1~~GFUD01100044.1.p1  ORF type:complete len:468 (+),score=107.71 GFUD01100044.1:185-1405(+)
MFDTLYELIEDLKENIDATIELKLGDICLIANPHSDDGFVYADKHMDSWMVPIHELEYDEEKDKLGEGQFGIVYEGLFRRTTKVALKKLKLKKDAASDKAWLEFLHEKEIMKRLNHPNLVQLYAIVNDPKEGNFLVQEYLNEGDLLQYLRKIRPLKDEADVIGVSFPKRLEWCVQVARGMAHLELLTIVHRDLAARNILLDKFFTAKVADFGMALALEDKIEGDDKIPIRWTAPEAMFDQNFSHSSDIWSYGVLMWEIFTFGDIPYGKSIRNEELKQKMQMDFDRKSNNFRCQKPRSSEKDMDDVYQIMTKCWDIEPSYRPKFSNLQHDVEHYAFTGDLSGYDTPAFEARRSNSIRSNVSSTSNLITKNEPISRQRHQTSYSRKTPPPPRSRTKSAGPRVRTATCS